MNQAKIGSFLRELRKQKGLTQEQIAEKFNVSNRTVSRWENGNNMPDIDILIEISDYYEVDLRDLLDGERKGENMDKELKETVMKVADYSNEEKKKIMKRMHFLFIWGLVSAIIYSFLLFTDKTDNFLGGLTFGITFGIMLVGVIMTSKYAEKFRSTKMRLFRKLKGE